MEQCSQFERGIEIARHWDCNREALSPGLCRWKVRNDGNYNKENEMKKLDSWELVGKK